MKTAIYSPYLNTLGGGERYIMTFADHLGKKGPVTIFWDDVNIKEQAKKRFNLSLENATVVPDIFKSAGKLKRNFMLRNFDVLVFLSDGSFPFGAAKTNILHMQVPYSLVNGRSVKNRLKLLTWQYVVCNSKFTKEHVDITFGTNSRVLYPPVDTEAFHPVTKDNTIITVGRFFGKDHGKKQELLIAAFKQLCDAGLKNWRFLVAGSIENRAYYNELQEMSRGYPITFFGNVPFHELVQLMGQARIYWHAQGFGEDDPKYQEHFGMATVEAMASGCVPIVIGKGGQKEIVDHGENGFLWSSEDELLSCTKNVIANSLLTDKISLAAIHKSKQFSKEHFYRELDNLLA